MRDRFFTALILCLSGCSGTAVDPVEPPLKWDTLKDGSQVAVGSTDPNMEDAASLIRCWKAGASYDCIAIQGRDWKDVRRTAPSTLPSMIWKSGEPIGYDCSIGSVGFGYQEHISGSAGKLTQHVASAAVGPVERSWSKDYVDSYMSANGIKPETLWYDCRAMTDAIQAGSNATIGSTSIDQKLLNGRGSPASGS